MSSNRLIIKSKASLSNASFGVVFFKCIMILVGFSLSSSQLSYKRPFITFKALFLGFQFSKRYFFFIG